MYVIDISRCRTMIHEQILYMKLKIKMILLYKIIDKQIVGLVGTK